MPLASLRSSLQVFLAYAYMFHMITENDGNDKRQQVFMKLLTVGGGVFVCDAHGTLDGSK